MVEVTSSPIEIVIFPVATVIDVANEYDVVELGNFLSLDVAVEFVKLYKVPSAFVRVNVDAKSAPCSIDMLTTGTDIEKFYFLVLVVNVTFKYIAHETKKCFNLK